MFSFTVTETNFILKHDPGNWGTPKWYLPCLKKFALEIRVISIRTLCAEHAQDIISLLCFRLLPNND